MLKIIISIIAFLTMNLILYAQPITCHVEKQFSDENFDVFKLNIHNESTKSIIIYFSIIYDNKSDTIPITPALIDNLFLNEVIIDLMKENDSYFVAENVICGEKIRPNKYTKFIIQIDRKYHACRKKIKMRYSYTSNCPINKKKVFSLKQNRRAARKFNTSDLVLIKIE